MKIKQLGDYRILREIARGGMGVVYLAEQVSLKRQVALKVLPSNPTQDSRQVKRFRREAEAAGKLHHPNIVPIYDVGDEDGTYFFSMEYIEGRTLDAVLEDLRWFNKPEVSEVDLQDVFTHRPEVSPDNKTQECVDQPNPGRARPDRNYVFEVVRIVLQLARALQYAHDLGVVHRDIKPSNIIVNEHGSPMLMDFGLARDDDDSAITRSGDIFGTPKYMSPEQVEASRSAIDGRTDIYSLGVTLYELVTFQAPFTGQSSQEILKKILTVSPIRPRKINRSLPSDLETIILKCLEKRPEDRYRTASDLAEDLDRFLGYQAIQARPLHPVIRGIRMVRRNGARAAAVALAMVLVIVTVLFFGLGQTATFMVESDPSRASVYIDGRLFGETPLLVEATAGELMLLLERKEGGFKPYKEVIEVFRGPNRKVSRSLAPLTFQIDMNVGDGTVYLAVEDENGVATTVRGDAGSRIHIPRRGLYTVRVEATDRETIEGRVEIGADGSWGAYEEVRGGRPWKHPLTQNYTVNPQANPRIEVNVQPPDVAVELISVESGESREIRSYPSLSTVNDSRHVVRVIEPGFHRETTKEIHAARGQTTVVNISAAPVERSKYPIQPSFFPPVMADLYRDGRLSAIVLVTEREPDPVGRMRILELGQGDLDSLAYMAPSGTFQCAASVVDFENDGFPEIVSVVGTVDQQELAIFTLPGSGEREGWKTYPLEAGGGITDGIVGDFDSNGVPDYAVGVEPRGVYVSWGGQEPELLEFPGLTLLGRDCVDLNNDGAAEFLVYAEGSELVALPCQGGEPPWSISVSGSPLLGKDPASHFAGAPNRRVPFFGVADLRTGERGSVIGDGQWEVLVRTSSHLSIYNGLDGRLVHEFELTQAEGVSPFLETPFLVGDVSRTPKSPGDEILVPTPAGIEIFSYSRRNELSKGAHGRVPDHEEVGLTSVWDRTERLSLVLAPIQSRGLDLILVEDNALYAMTADPASKDPEVLFRFTSEGGSFLAPCVGDLDGDDRVEVMVVEREEARLGVVHCLTGHRPRLRGGSAIDWRWESPHRVSDRLVTGDVLGKRDVPSGVVHGDEVEDLILVEMSDRNSHLSIISGRTGRVLGPTPLDGTISKPPSWLHFSDGGGGVLMTQQRSYEEREYPLHSLYSVLPYAGKTRGVRPPDKVRARIGLPSFVDFGMGASDGGTTRFGLFSRAGGELAFGAIRFSLTEVVALSTWQHNTLGKVWPPSHLGRRRRSERLWSLKISDLGDRDFASFRSPPDERDDGGGLPVTADLNGDGAVDLLIEAVGTATTGEHPALQLICVSGDGGEVLWMGPTSSADQWFEVDVLDLGGAQAEPDVFVKVWGMRPGITQPVIERLYGINGATGTTLMTVDLASLCEGENVVQAAAMPNATVGPDSVVLTDKGLLGWIDSRKGVELHRISLLPRTYSGSFTPRLQTFPSAKDYCLVQWEKGVSLLRASTRSERWRVQASPGRIFQDATLIRRKKKADAPLIVVQEAIEEEGRLPWTTVTAYLPTPLVPFLWSDGCFSGEKARVQGNVVSIRRALSRGELVPKMAERLLRRLPRTDAAYPEVEREAIR